MHIDSLVVENFKGIRNLSLRFEPGITTLIGENNTGKSSIGAAISKAFSSGAQGNNSFDVSDLPYGAQSVVKIDVGCRLQKEEIQEVASYLIPTETPSDRMATITTWLNNQGELIHLIFSRSQGVDLEWGSLRFHSTQISGSSSSSATGSWPEYVRSGSDRDWSTATYLNAAVKDRTYDLGVNLSVQLSQRLLEKFKIFSEFRQRSSMSNTSEIESLSGDKTASVLHNLRVHRESSQRDRYQRIVETFNGCFPRFHIEAVERTPGTGEPEIQFFERGQTKHLSLEQLSAGVQEILTLITNVVGRDGLIVFAENPECN